MPESTIKQKDIETFFILANAWVAMHREGANADNMVSVGAALHVAKASVPESLHKYANPEWMFSQGPNQ